MNELLGTTLAEKARNCKPQGSRSVRHAQRKTLPENIAGCLDKANGFPGAGPDAKQARWSRGGRELTRKMREFRKVRTLASEPNSHLSA